MEEKIDVMRLIIATVVSYALVFILIWIFSRTKKKGTDRKDKASSS